MLDINIKNITVDKIDLPSFSVRGIAADVLRLDKIHPVVSGNKWFKLRYYFEDFIISGKKGIITFGGAWSNHIIATAAACKLNNIMCTGIIRGEAAPVLSATLNEAKNLGMKLIFINREDYRLKKLPAELNKNDYYIIPEGGYGDRGMNGAATILDNINLENYTHICCAAGTGTMAAGMIKAAGKNSTAVIVSVLKNNFDLEKNIKSLVTGGPFATAIIHDYSFGGYAKHSAALLRFMNDFYSQTQVPTDFVYTGKLFYAINNMISNGFFPSGSGLLLVHSGGLQGNASLRKGALIF
jgi:1-aminocyclopropane-1-carboxylate deaminase